ncbi:MAG: lytic transglycosylase domain-containing protein [Gammaproteobacteria bacterium]|nr:lytic transglycosylase domain-containing protein [Gammaproteobacteria bacterium]MBU0786145.1 lytic transglycosylase domain-containing protein [Gammaproteobacteria bacterium]MBU0816725.1 lytic transglycosylase domain-containing protein [Gammaproteobacteria bacterium]MBU1786889.1 lytic transglycosylase domain-containing protein [Gammaproteobacteria bacterium]
MRSGIQSRFGMRRLWGVLPMLVLALLLLFWAQSARADVWVYMDEKGDAHFSTRQLDERYELFSHSGQGFDTGAPPADGRTAREVAVPTSQRRLQIFFDVSPSYKSVRHHLREASKRHDIDLELLQALIATESGFDARAVSPRGATGLMQIMPATAQRYGVRADRRSTVQAKLFDPDVNIATGARYLAYLIKLFPGQLELALAAYNAGEGAVQRAGNRIPNYKETQDYVATVMRLYTLLKPPVLVTELRSTPQRLRMELPGGAARRGNMLAPLPSTVATNDTTERDY